MIRGWWRVQRALGRLRSGAEPNPSPPRRSWGGWDDLRSEVLVVCHPEWRGVRTAAYAHGDPVVEVEDAGTWAKDLTDRAADAGVRTLVVHGFPPGSDRLVDLAHERGLRTAVVLHSSTAQHGGEPAEAAVVDRVFELARAGRLDRAGFVKAGLAEAFRALGLNAWWVPNRAPAVPDGPAWVPDGDGLHVGVFAEPIFRKNVVTQLAAVAVLDGARAHVLHRPDVGYLATLPIIEHGLLRWEDFVRLQAGMDLNLYVSLSECHPLSPVESYLVGVPCLMSRTSRVFADDRELWAVTTIDTLDDPTAIAGAAQRLLDNRAFAVERARDWIRRADADAAERWAAFTRH